MKILHFIHRGDHYQVNEQGHIKANGLDHFSPSWEFLGGSSHHWHNHITVNRETAFQYPQALNGCLFWDLDHGTVRQHGGRYYGRLPRIQNAYITEA